jgi:hypothetical protein
MRSSGRALAQGLGSICDFFWVGFVFAFFCKHLILPAEEGLADPEAGVGFDLGISALGSFSRFFVGY